MHPNVTVIHEICEYDGRVFISMEYVEGETLKQIIENKSEMLTVEKVLDIMVQICEGLRSAHEKNIIHRDIKSDNIMLTPGGQVKIMDFGLAKMSGVPDLHSRAQLSAPPPICRPSRQKVWKSTIVRISFPSALYSMNCSPRGSPSAEITRPP